MNPLRNKAVVSGLVVVAAVITISQFVDWPSRKPLAASARTAPSQQPAPTFDAPSQPSVLLGLSNHVDFSVSGRDPFAWPRRTQPAGGASVPFVVSAISIDAGKALAVINQRVVAPGDRIGEYVVEQILPNQVHLRGPDGSVTARMAR